MKINKKLKYVELKKFILEKNMKQQELADLLGIDRSTFNSKFNSNETDTNLFRIFSNYCYLL